MQHINFHQKAFDLLDSAYRGRRLALPLVASLACGASVVSCRAQNNTGPVQFRIDATKGRVPISPFIYGANGGGALATTNGVTLTRFGGNRVTAYNWENNASNAGSDYVFQNDGIMGGGDVAGSALKSGVASAFQSNEAIILTVPIGDYVAADKNGGGDVNKTPDYLHTRFRENRPRKSTPFAYPPDVSDRFVYQDEMVAWIERSFPNAHDNTPKTIFYALDNEPDLWSATHARVHPQPVTYAELIRRSIDYSTAIKSVAPKAQIFGFVSYGFNGYQSLQNAPDANGRDFTDFFLDSMRQAQAASGKRLVDVLDLHWYPEAYGGGKRISDAGNMPPELVTARLQAPRSLWDPNYAEESWISKKMGGAIRLLPRLKQQIAKHYPGTKLAFTEYNYGGTNDISGGLAQADVLGIFGREGVFAAAFWSLTGADAYAYAGFAAYRNYDGKGAHVGDTNIAAETNDNARTSVYANVDSADSNKMYVIAINKTNALLPVDMALTTTVNFTGANIYKLTRDSAVLQAAGTARVANKHLTVTLPAMSVCTFVMTQ